MLSPEINRYLSSIGEDCKNKGFKLRETFVNKDGLRVGKISYYEFRNCIEKLNPNMNSEIIYKMSRPFLAPDEKINYEGFVKEVERLSKAKFNFHQLLDQIIERFEAGETNLFDLFMKADKNGNGNLSKQEFEDVLQDFGIYATDSEINDAMEFLDLNGDKNLDYKEMRIVFDQYCREKGKNFGDMQKSHVSVEDPETYWGREIMIKMDNYLAKQNKTLDAFFVSMGMEPNELMSRFDFTTALSTAYPDISRKDEDRMLNEYEDRKVGKIAVSKFKRMYEKVNRTSHSTPSFPANRSAYGGASGGSDSSEKTAEECLQRVVNAISNGGHSVSVFFEKYPSYNKFLRNIKEDDFTTAVKDLNIYFTSAEQRAISFYLDKKAEGIYDLAKVFTMRPTAGPSFGTSEDRFSAPSVDPKQLSQLLDKIADFAHREKLDLPDLFRRQDFRNDGYVTVDEFNRILKDARLSLDTGEFDMLKHSYTNARGEFDYKKFLDLVTDRIKTKRETEQQSKERLLRDFYNKIREKFNTVDEFFTKYDANGDRTIDKSEFIKIIKEFDQKMTSVEVVDLFNYLDPNTTGKIQPYSMNQVFKPFLEDEVKNIMQAIVNGLTKGNTNYYKLMHTFPVSGPFIKRLDFQDALDSLGIRNQVSSKQVDFLLAYFGIKPNNKQEIDFEEFGAAFASFAKQLNLPQAFEIMTAFEKVSTGPSKTVSEVQKFAEKLTTTNKKDLTTAFRAIELKDNRYIHFPEFERLLLKADPTISVNQVDVLFKELDKNNFGRIPVSEFQHAFGIEEGASRDFHHHNEPAQPQKLYLTAKEATAMKDFKERVGLKTKKDILDFYRGMDRNDDKSVTYQEFKRASEIMDSGISSTTLMTVFKILDPNNVGKFTSVDFLEKMGMEIEPESGLMRQSTNRLVNQGSSKRLMDQQILNSFRDDLSSKERREMMNYFQSMKRENEGYLSGKEFREIVKFIRPRTNDNDITTMFEIIDAKNNKRVPVADFLSALQLEKNEYGHEKKPADFPRPGSAKTALEKFRENLTVQIKKDMFNSFKNLLRDDERYLTIHDFTVMVRKADRYIKESELKELFDLIDTRRTGQITNQQFIEAFNLEEVANTVSDIYSKTQPQGPPANALSSFIDRLTTQNKRELTDFLLNMGRTSQELDNEGFKRAIQRVDPYVDESEARKMYAAMDPKFTNRVPVFEILKNLKLEIPPETRAPTKIDIIRKTEYAADFLTDFVRAFLRSGRQFKDEFWSYDGKIPVTKFKAKLNELDLRPSSNANQVIADLTDERDYNSINVSYLEQVYEHYKTIVERQNQSTYGREPSAIDVIKEKMRDNKYEFDVFERYDRTYKGFISDYDFRDVLRSTLKINFSSEQLKTLEREIYDANGAVNLDKLRNALGFRNTRDDRDRRDDRGGWGDKDRRDDRGGWGDKDRRDDRGGWGDKDRWDDRREAKDRWDDRREDKDRWGDQKKVGQSQEPSFGSRPGDALIKKIREEARIRGISMARLFDSFDMDQNDTLEFPELRRIVSYIDPSIPHEDVIELFKRFDKDKSGRISQREFLTEFPEERIVSIDEAERVLDGLKKKLRISDRNEMARMFNLIDSNNSRAVSLEEFSGFVKMVDSSLGRDQILGVFQLIDADHNGRLTFNEFKKHFDPDNVSNLRHDDGQQSMIKRVEWAAELFEEMDYLLRVNRTEFRDFFTKSDTKLKNFKKKLLSLDLDLTDRVFDRLMNCIVTYEDPDIVDLRSFQAAFEHYTQRKLTDPLTFKRRHLEKLKSDITLALRAKYASFDDIFGRYERETQMPLEQFERLLKSLLGLSSPTNVKILADHLGSSSYGPPNYINIRDFKQFVLGELDVKSGTQRQPDVRASDQSRLSYTNPVTGRGEPPMTVMGEIANYPDQQAVSIFNQLKQQVEFSGIEVEKLFEPFHVNRTEKLDFTEFSRALRKIRNDLSRDELVKVFRMFDRENRDEASKFEVIHCLSRIPGYRIAQYLESHRDLFAELNKQLNVFKTDPSKVFKPDHNLISAHAFRNGLWTIAFDFDKYKRDLAHIQDALLEGRKDGLNFQILELCLEKYRHGAAPNKELSPQEMENVRKILKTVHNFMQEDRITFEELFASKDRSRSGSITKEDLKYSLVKQLRIDETPALLLMINYVCNEYDRVPLDEFRRNLEGDIGTAPGRMSFGGQQAQQMTLEEYIKAIRGKFNDRTEAVIKFYDQNDNKKISRKEFVDTTIMALGLNDDTCMNLFKQIDKTGEGVISTWQFKDLLDSATQEDKGFLLKLANFVVANEREVLKNLRDVDDTRSKKLHNNQIKMAFSICGFSLSNEQVEQIIRATNIPKDLNGNVNYEELVERIKKLVADANQKGFSSVDETLRKIKTAVIAKGVDLIQVLKKHVRRSDDRVPINAIIEELSNFDIYLSKEEREPLMALLPQVDNQVNHIDFAKLVINGRGMLFNENEMRLQFGWAEPLLRAIQQRLAEMRMTVPRFFNTTNEFYPIIDFRSGLQQLRIDYGTPEVRKLVDQLTNPNQPLNLNLFKLQYLIENLDNLFGPPKKQLTPEEQKLIDMMVKNINNFMMEDKLTFQSLFGKYDHRNQGFIHTDELKKILYHDLQIDESEKTNKFVYLMSDEKHHVDLRELEDRLKGINPAISRPNQPYSMSNTQTSGWHDRPATQDQWKTTSNLGWSPDSRGKENQFGSTDTFRPQDNRFATADNRPYDNRYGGTDYNKPQDNRFTGSDGFKPQDNRYGADRYGGAEYSRTQDTRYGAGQLDSRYTKPEDNRFGGATTYNYGVERPPLEPLDDTPQGLINQMKMAFRKKNMTNEEKFKFFDEYNTGKIPMDIFVDKVGTLGITALADRIKAEDFFNYLDVNKNKFISKQEFQVTFDEAADVSRDVDLGHDIQAEIYKLFKEIDSNNDGSIGREELAHCLSVVGTNPSPEEIDAIFAQMDSDRDGKIVFGEFRVILERKLRKDILQMEQLLSDLRFEFKKADINNDRQLGAPQLNQVLINLGIELKPEELNAIFKTIDTDRNGKIDIDEFIDFMSNTGDTEQFDPTTSSAIMNIKKYKKLSPFDLYNCFKLMPQSFTLSFTRDLNRVRENLPSSTMKPQLDAGGIFFTDLFPNDSSTTMTQTNKGPKLNSYVRPIPTYLGAEIKLLLATGIPIPSEQVDRKAQFVAREVRAALFDFGSNKFVGNVVTIAADWRPEYEDRWYFKPSKIRGESRLYFRMADFDEKTQANLAIVFDFVVFYKVSDTQLIEMSSGWTKIEVTKLGTPQTLSLSLNGGTPKKMTSINEMDVRTKREGWRYVVKKISKKIMSKLDIVIIPHDRLPIEVKNQLTLLPKTILLNKNSLDLLRYAREHLAKLVLDANNVNAVLQNIHEKTFRNAMDCPDVWPKFYLFWNMNISPRLIKAPSPDNGIEFLIKCLEQLYLLFSSVDFAFSPSDPTQRVYQDYALYEKRAKLLNSCFDKILQALAITTTAKKFIGLEHGFETASAYKPFNILELIDEDEDSYVMEQLQRIKQL